MDPAFSRRGESATPFERELMDQPDIRGLQSEQELWVDLAKRVGLDNLLLIFDEMGGRKVWIPTREKFVHLAWSEIRNREIHRLHAQRLSIGEISRAMGVDKRTVRHVVQRRPFSAAPNREKQRA